jgi:N-acetyl-gamma-glutamyl-phosphate reductase
MDSHNLHTYAMGPTRVSVAVLGASGYAGGELVRLLEAHPRVDVTLLGGSGSAGRPLREVQPHLAASSRSEMVLAPIEDAGAIAAAAEVALCALPNGTSAGLAPRLLEAGMRVVDLAGDFRLPAEAYPEWYGFEHPAPAWLDKAVYGLPELFGERIAGAELVANPGCYPTPVTLGLAPLLASGAVGSGPIVVDGKTGLSGAGRTATEATGFNATEESIRPYRVPRHQHTPEIERALSLATGAEARVLFVPHLVPTVRGVLTTCYAPLTGARTTEELTGILQAAYADAPFVRVLAPGEMVDSKRVRGSNAVELQALADPRTGQAIVAGAVDNLIKGAAGQAIQNLNLMLGVDASTGLSAVGMVP